MIDDHDLDLELEVPRRRVEASDDSNWLTSFSDLVTILMVFFVIMISPTDFSAMKFERSKEAFSGSSSMKNQSIHDVFQKLEETVSSSDLKDGATIEDRGHDIAITLDDRMLFHSGRTEILPEQQGVVKKLAKVLSELPGYARIAIEGYTDDNPIHTKHFDSNWQLSAERALSVLKIFEAEGLCQKNCELRGFGQTKPFLPNRDERGYAISSHQAKNRRVVVRIY